MGSLLNICLRKSSSAESRSAESLLKEEMSLFNIENNPAPCFFRALKQNFNTFKISTTTGKNYKTKKLKGAVIFTLSSGTVRIRAR